MLAEPDSGVCSLATSYTASSEENTPKRAKRVDRKGAIHSLMTGKKERPVSWHGRGRVELTVHPKPVENENPFTKEDLKYHDEILKAFNKRYEVSNSALAKINRKAQSVPEKENNLKRSSQDDAGNTKNPWMTGKKRVRPSSWIGVSHTPKPYEAKCESVTSPSLIGRI